MHVSRDTVIEEPIFLPNHYFSLNSKDYHYNLAGIRIDPQQQVAQPVRLVDERHRNNTISNSTHNEREQ